MRCDTEERRLGCRSLTPGPDTGVLSAAHDDPMRVDLLAGTLYGPRAMVERRPTILIFDSGLGGLTVFAEVLKED